ncbi:GNAT family N-acetyltransferase, partial [Vibrio sp. 10N.261.49.A5]
MKKTVFIEGMSFRLRLVTVEDADFIVKLRLQDAERNKYINPISSDIAQQQQWIEHYLKKNNDYYFVVED